ncbi:MAG: hypothetical protein NTW25_05235 [Candidatus Kapabacteria bacterium]|nr:hypothetical protein [Candidatus Kapabacteria bacterium]
MEISSLNSSSYIQNIKSNNVSSSSASGIKLSSNPQRNPDSITISQEALQLSQNKALSIDKDNDGDAA